MRDRNDSNRRYLEVWNGDADLSELDNLVIPSYVGHLGSRNRDLGQLKRDIADYRSATPTVRFTLEHQFGEGGYFASRLIAEGTDATGKAISARGLNISRWEGSRLAEEWAVWEPLRHLPT